MKFCKSAHTKCHMSHFTCHISHVTCHVSHVTCIFLFLLFFWQSAVTSGVRVCYQRGLPCLVKLHPDDDDKFISTYGKYELHPKRLRYHHNAGHHLICCKSMGYWLTMSVWPCMTSRLQRPNERLSDIIGLLTKGWGTWCGVLWYI